ncbi:hypothetical protein [Bradyrhizobium sp. CB2312]|uniref:hypothetical protein n=1 Tax=Bradyrhizobium sp. CB2312 TaxID=3039155 RepID=UPI0024B07BEF|nr:hypothetical protein [Bradyrhizobium sp. CB2312]WFU73822.1 hypothetical protein QA642_07110 [Bradyrhizobium sp. CB2312]
MLADQFHYCSAVLVVYLVAMRHSEVSFDKKRRDQKPAPADRSSSASRAFRELETAAFGYLRERFVVENSGSYWTFGYPRHAPF